MPLHVYFFSSAPATSILILLAFFSAALSGCTPVGPHFTAVASSKPISWTTLESSDPKLKKDLAITEKTLHAPWWALFNDPVLSALQDEAMQKSPDIQTALLHFAQSRVQRDTIAAQKGPQLNAGGSLHRERLSEYASATRLADAVTSGNRNALVSLLSSPFTLYQSGFDASWELDLWGRIHRLVESANAQVQASAAMLEGFRLSLSAEIARNYFELRQVQQQLRLLEEDIQALNEGLSLNQARATGGLISELDYTRHNLQLNELHAQKPPLLARQAALMNAITLLLGHTPGTLLDKLHAPLSLPAASALPDLALGLASDIIRNRPDIRAAENQLHAATANIGVAIADLYPRITLGLQAGYESYQQEKFGEWGTRTWQLGPSLSLPLFDQGRRRSVVVLRRLEQQEAAVAYQKTVLKAWHEVDDALIAYSAERQRSIQLQHKLDDSRTIYDLAQARYTAGLTDFLPVLDSRRLYLQAQRDLSDNTHRLFLNVVRIHKAIGSQAAVQASG